MLKAPKSTKNKAIAPKNENAPEGTRGCLFFCPMCIGGALEEFIGSFGS